MESQLDFFPNGESNSEPFYIYRNYATRKQGDWQARLNMLLIQHQDYNTKVCECPLVLSTQDNLLQRKYIIITPAETYIHKKYDYIPLVDRKTIPARKQVHEFIDV